MKTDRRMEAGVLVSLVAWCMVLMVACPNGVSPKTAGGIEAGLVAAECVLTRINEPPAQIALDCGTDLANVARVLAAHSEARRLEAMARVTDGGASSLSDSGIK